MKNAVSFDVTPRGPCKNRRFGGKYRLHHQSDMVLFLRSMLRLLITANVVPSVQILVLMIRSSETSVLTRGARGNIPASLQPAATKPHPHPYGTIPSIEV
jgi:hypothetical protein